MQAHKNVNVLNETSVTQVVPCVDGMNVQLEKAHQNIKRIQVGLVVLAEGGQSQIATGLGIKGREVDYNQNAIIANIMTER